VNAPARFFHSILSVCEVLVLAGFDSVSAGLCGAVHTYDILLRSVHVQEVQPCIEHPSLVPLEAIGRTPRLVCASLRHPFAGTKGEVYTSPIRRVVNRGSLFELLTGGSSGHPCPVR
jgi:hypothetical protein